jgi:hypothetical protein
MQIYFLRDKQLPRGVGRNKTECSKEENEEESLSKE